MDTAHTIHKSQGGTYKYSFVNDLSIESGFKNYYGLKKQLKYVAVTRAEKLSFILTSSVKNENEDSLLSPKDFEENKDFHYPRHWNSTMRSISNKHFRKELSKTRKTSPRYPFKIPFKRAMKLIDDINNEYGTEVVRWGIDYNARTSHPSEGIVFTKDVKMKPEAMESPNSEGQLTLFSPRENQE